MKQFNEHQLLALKNESLHLVEALDSYKNLVIVYYNSLAVLQYFDFLGEDNVSQAELRFWIHINELALRKAPQIENEVLPLFEEMTEFEDSLIKARTMCFHVHHDPQDELKYRSLLKLQAERREYYQYLRQLAGIYLDVLSENPRDEHYKLWRHYYNRISERIELPERGDAQDDEMRLSLPELELFLEENEACAKNEGIPPCSRMYWQTRANHTKALIKARQTK